MTSGTVDLTTAIDGTLVIRAQGVLGVDHAIDLRHTLVHAIRHTRPLRLILELGDMQGLDAINLGTLVAACHLGDDHNVAVFFDHCPTDIAGQFIAAGVLAHRLRRVGSQPQAA